VFVLTFVSFVGTEEVSTTWKMLDYLSCLVQFSVFFNFNVCKN
jgi:hypothetical protein